MLVAISAMQVISPLDVMAANGSWSQGTFAGSGDGDYTNTQSSGGDLSLSEKALSNSGGGDWDYRKKITIDNSAGGALTDYQVSVDSEKDLVGHWNFDETSGNAYDSSWQENDGTLAGTGGPIQNVSGRFGNAISFDGNDYVNGGTDSTLDFERTDSFSASAWMKRDISDLNMMIMGKAVNGGNYNGWYMFSPSNKIRIILRNDNSPDNSIRVDTVNTFPEINVWHHYAFTYDGSSDASGVKIYVDGVLQSTSVASNTLTGSMKSAAAMNIGAYGNSAAYLQGDIDEAKVFKKKLSSGEIWNEYQQQKPLEFNRYQSDGDDIRFTDSDGKTELNHWKEEFNNTVTGKKNYKYWVKTSVGAGTTKDIYMYYGNSSATASSYNDPDNTFIQYHGFATAEFHDSNVASGHGIATRMNITISSTAGQNVVFGAADTLMSATATNSFTQQHYQAGNAKYGYSVANGSGDSFSVAGLPSTGVPHIWEAKYSSGIINYYVDGVEYGSGINTNLPTASLGLAYWQAQGTGSVHNWSVIRKYTANEPTVTEQGGLARMPYKREMSLTTNGSLGGATVTTDQYDFPVAVHINSSSWTDQTSRDRFFDNAGADGKGVQFWESDESHTLDYEVEYFDNTQGAEEAIYWVRVPKVDGNSVTDKIYVAYGRDTGQDEDNTTGVWINGYAAVWHFNDTLNDSTINAKHLSDYATNGFETGQIGKAQGFDGSDYLKNGTGADWKWMHYGSSGNPEWTYESWYQVDNPNPGTIGSFFGTLNSLGSASIGVAVCYEDRLPKNRGLWAAISRNVSGQMVLTGSSDNIFPNDSSQHHMMSTYKHTDASSNWITYVDGIQKAAYNKTGYAPTSANANDGINIGRNPPTSYYFPAGSMDEIRVHYIKRSADYGKLSHLSASGSGFSGESFLQWGPPDQTGNYSSFGYETSGTFVSDAIPSDVNHQDKVYEWGDFTFTHTLNGQTITYDILNGATDNPIGGFTGLTTTPTDLSSINALVYPSLKIRANLSGDGISTPTVDTLGIAYSYDVTAPTTPANFTLGTVASDSIQISWDASTDAESGVAGYEVQRAPDSGGVPGAWGAASGDCTGTVLATTCTDSPLSANTKYYYKVRAVDDVDNYSGWNNEGSGGDTYLYNGELVHAFTSVGSSNFVPPTGVSSVKALVVAGGGGGGSDGGRGGGGGAGGLVYNASYAVTPQSYNVVVGDGGAGSNPTASINGENSSFAGSITAIGGGRGGGIFAGGSGSGGNGGCGGGENAYYVGTYGIGSQGYNGGLGVNSPYYGAGGGGGMGAVGGNGSGHNGGNGGVGVNYSAIFGTTYGENGWFSGGGGGGATGVVGVGGNGGGGDANGGDAITNTGGGGGGHGGDGGSGVVLISYVPAGLSATTLVNTPTISAPTTPQATLKPTISGTGATPSTEVRLYDNGVQKASLTSAGDGTFTFNSSTPGYTDLTEGNHTNITVRGYGDGGETGDSAPVTIFVDTQVPTAPTTRDAAKVDDAGGNDIDDNAWNGNNNGDTVYFEWSGATDPAPSSSIKRYWVYFGPNPAAVPRTEGQATADATTNVIKTLSSPTSGSDYYLRIQTEDNAGNISSDGSIPTLFTYKFDDTEPSAPTTVTPDPSAWSEVNSFDFSWTNWTEADSGISHYLYSRKETSGGDTYEALDPINRKVDDNVNPIEANGVEALFSGTNWIRVYAVDNAGNTSSTYGFAPYFYTGTVPGPENMAAVPGFNTENSFTFSFSKPAAVTATGYYCGVSSPLSAENTTFIDLSSPPATLDMKVGERTEENVPLTVNGDDVTVGPYAAASAQGQNTFYCATKDDLGNIGWSAPNPTNTTFTINSSAPDVAGDMRITDASDRGTSNWALTVGWTALTGQGADFDGYSVYKCTSSCDNDVNYSKVAEVNTNIYSEAGLNNTVDYYYKIKSRNNVGVESAFSASVNKIPTGKFTTPPTYTSEPDIEFTATSATINWTTDRESNSIVQYGTEGNLDQEASKSTEEVTDHEIDISGLAPGTEYTYRVQSLDQDRDYDPTTAYSSEYTFTTLEEPGISEVEVSDVGLYSAIITWKTTSSATSKIKYGTTTSYGSEVIDHSGSQVTTHTVKIDNLEHSTLYHFKVTGTDVDGNFMQSDDYVFSTLIYPRIMNVKYESVVDAAVSTMKVVWESNVPMTSVVEYRALSGGPSLEVSSSKLQTKHEIVVTNLRDNTEYVMIAKGRDAYGNQGTGGEEKIKTDFDTRPPEISNVLVEHETIGFGTDARGQMVISWETDEPATSQIEFGLGAKGSEYTHRTQEDSSLTTSHVVIISDLKTSSPYHFRIVSRDASENAGYSDDQATLTGQAIEGILEILIKSLEATIGWLFRY